MHFSSHRRGPTPAASRISLIALCFLSAAIVASSAAEKQAAVALQTLEFEEPINWYFISDIGLLHLHGDGEIYTFDLLDKGRAFAPPMSFPLADDPLSVVHLSGTRTLLIATARSGKVKSNAAGDGLSSYGVALPSGELLWEQPALALPKESYYFPEEDLVVLQSGKKGHDYTAVDRSTGAVRWSKEVNGSHVVLEEDTLVILGPESSEIDVRTGQPIWTLDLSKKKKTQGLFFPSVGTAVLWDKKSLKGYGLAALPTNSSQEPKMGEAGLLWQAKVNGAVPDAAIKNGFCNSQVLGEDRFWIAARFKYEAHDAKTGELLWTRKRLGYKPLEPSPSGELAATIHKDKLLIVDLESGQTKLESKAPKPKRAKDTLVNFIWLNDIEFLIVFQDRNSRPTGLARYDSEAHATVWNRELPKPVEYRTTGKQKAARVGRVFTAIGTALITIANPVSIAGTKFYFWYAPGLRSRSLRAEGGSRASRDEVDEEVNDAWTRFITVRERVARSHDRELRFPAGPKDDYTLNVLDLASGKISHSLSYEALKVHSIEPDLGSGLWVTVENDRRSLKVVGERDP